MSNPVVFVRLEIRPATLDDAQGLSEAAARMFETTFGPDNTAEDMASYLTSAFTVEKQRAELADPERATFIVDANGTIGGYATMHRGARSAGVTGERPAEIQRIYVDRSYQGMRMGESLMMSCLHQARRWQCDQIWLAVWERNARAIAFYTKHGFRKVGGQDFQLGSDLQHDHVMARNLSLTE
jgi:ribosomal protein S18 acetylase RimI-like enzyme